MIRTTQDFPYCPHCRRRRAEADPRPGWTASANVFSHLRDFAGPSGKPAELAWVLSTACIVVLLCLCMIKSAMAQSIDPSSVETRIARIDELLHSWQINEARHEAEALLQQYPDLPAVELEAAWVKFHLGRQQAAETLASRAVAALGPRLQMDARVVKIRAMARITRGFIRRTSAEGKVEIQFAPGPDEILVPDLTEAISRTLSVVGEDLGYTPQHTIVAQILPDAVALADATGLTEEQINTSGTIAVCKFTRLLVTSPRMTLRGYSYLDTVSHELVHLIISEKTSNHTPIWIHEALAKFEETRWRRKEPLYRAGLDPIRQSRLARAMAGKKLITFEQMHPSMALLPSRKEADLAYSEVYTVTQFLLDRKGYSGIGELLDFLSQGEEDLRAIERVYGLGRKRFVSAWLRWLKRQKLVILQGDEISDSVAGAGKKTKEEKELVRVKRLDLQDRYRLGQLLRARGKNIAALVEFTKAWNAMGTGHAAKWIIGDQLGQVLMQTNRSQEAIDVFREGLRVYPQDLQAHLYLGMILAKADPYRAFLHLREASRLNPFDPRVRGFLASVCEKLAESGDHREDFALLAKRNKAAFSIVRRMGKSESRQNHRPEQVVNDQTSFIRIFTSPWARVWLDGWDTGITSPVYSLAVMPGFHVVGLDARCLEKPRLEVVEVQPGRTVVVDMELCPNQIHRAK